MISYQLIKTNNFTAKTEIKPIGPLELNKFFIINNLNTTNTTNTTGATGANTTNTTNTTGATGANTTNTTNTTGATGANTNKITSLRLLNLYLDMLKDRSVFEDAIRKLNLLEASQYNNEQEYSEAIIKLASYIKILSPSAKSEAKKGNLETSYHSISFTYHDAEKWKSVLTLVDEFANKLVKKTLLNEYNNFLLFLKNERKHQLEDISTKIDNLLIDYERESSDRVAYLEEQSEIAKTLEISRNTTEVQKFANESGLLSNVIIYGPFYLRGYEAIDKEIELIKLRENKNAFVKGLLELEKEKRAIEQNQTIERVKLVIESNLLADNNEFSAASINAITTKFEYKVYKTIYVLTIVIGLMAGIFYVLISNAFQSLRVSKKN